MMMPGRKYSAGNGYRYGFNGKEKNDEMLSEEYDFGARIYDGRIGRWLKPDKLEKKYPNLSTYSFGANVPIFIKDADGNVLRDANGNIIYTSQGASVQTENLGGGIYRSFEKVWIYANDGTKVEAFIVTVSKVGYGDVTNQNLEVTYDCHGLTQTQNKFFINSGDPIEDLLRGDRNGKLKESKDLSKAKMNDIIIFRGDNTDENGVTTKNRVIHSAIVNGDGTYDSKNGGYYAEEKKTWLIWKTTMESNIPSFREVKTKQ